MSFTPTFDSSNFEILGETQGYSGFLSIKQYTLNISTFEGNTIGPIVRECVMYHPAVFILPYDPAKDTVVLVEQFRIGAKDHLKTLGIPSPWVLEIPAGAIDAGETTDQAVRRELKEETGLNALKIQRLFSLMMSPSDSNALGHYHCASVDTSNIKDLHGVADEDEHIKLHCFDRKHAITMIERGDISTEPAVIALQWLDKHWQRFQ